MDEPDPKRILVDFPDPLPVSEDELALIEAHMGAIIAAMLQLGTAEAAGLPEAQSGNLLPRRTTIKVGGFAVG